MAYNPCGVSYAQFRSGWTFTDAAEMLGGRGDPTSDVRTQRPSRRRILKLMGRLKREEYAEHERRCAEQLDEDDWSDVRSEDFPGFEGLRDAERQFMDAGGYWWIVAAAAALFGYVAWKRR